jgi:hypothetical protein
MALRSYFTIKVTQSLRYETYKLEVIGFSYMIGTTHRAWLDVMKPHFIMSKRNLPCFLLYDMWSPKKSCLNLVANLSCKETTGVSLAKTLKSFEVGASPSSKLRPSSPIHPLDLLHGSSSKGYNHSPRHSHNPTRGCGYICGYHTQLE